jgi:polyisoprenoid-binding protein YceI
MRGRFMSKRFLLIGGGLVLLGALAVAAIVIIQLIRSDDPDLLTEAPAIPAASPAASPVATAASGATPAATQGSPSLPAGVLHFVVGEGSSAKYVVREKLTRLPVSTNAVGETTAVTGDLYLTTRGLATALQSTFRVDLRQLRSDESLRDNYIRTNSLRTSQFPFAEFTIASVNGFPANYVEGTEVSMTLTGQLTVRGVTREVTWEVKARRSGDTITAIADTDFNMTDFGITPPDVALAKSEDGVHLQVVIVAKQRPG